nr:MAG TPA: hypothetical protein [Caudoviricetes sp.]
MASLFDTQSSNKSISAMPCYYKQGTFCARKRICHG